MRASPTCQLDACLANLSIPRLADLPSPNIAVPSLRHPAGPTPLAGLDPAKTEPLGIATMLTGQSYAQLLYVDRGALADDLVIAATEENEVTAASAATGQARACVC